MTRKRDSFKSEWSECGRRLGTVVAGGVTEGTSEKATSRRGSTSSRRFTVSSTKPHTTFAGKPKRRGDSQQVGEQSAVIPAEMAVGAVLILPGVAPVGGGADDGQRGVRDGRLAGGSLDQDAAKVSGAQAAQSKLGSGEVIDAGFEVGRSPTKIAADQIEFDFVERSGAGGGAKVYFAAGIFSVPGDASGEIEELSDSFQVRAARFAAERFRRSRKERRLPSGAPRLAGARDPAWGRF